MVLVGAPGSGKGTQGPQLAAQLDAAFLSVGELLRAEVAQSSPLGRRVAATMERGELVADAVVTAVVLAHLDGAADYVLDGFPRTVAQAESLWRSSARPDVALELVVSSGVIVRRLRDRGRADDTPSTVRTRLAVYEQQTAPVLAWFARRDMLERVDANGTPEAVTAAGLAALKQRLRMVDANA